MTQAQAAATTQVQDRSAIRWSYASGPSDAPLLGLAIGDALDQTAARLPDNDALIYRCQRLRYTYAQLREGVDRCARGQLALEIRRRR
jgi:fatty-acyl-CoA synthase